MPLIPPLSDAQASDAAKAQFQALKAKLGAVLNFYRTLGHAPEILEATLAMSKAIQGRLDPKLRELAYLKTSEVNGCHY
jgi:alkylhydroperoxidase family enzyme